MGTSVITALWVPVVVGAHIFAFFWLLKAYLLESPRAFSFLRRWLGRSKLEGLASAHALPSPKDGGGKDAGSTNGGGVVDLDAEEQVVLTLSQKRSVSKDAADGPHHHSEFIFAGSFAGSLCALAARAAP